LIDRYTRPEMARIWSQENKYRQWLRVEALAVRAWAELGVIPRDAAERIARAQVSIDAEFVRRVAEVEAQTHHDVIAFVTVLAERLGDDGRYIHYGLTSYDVVDTALSLQLVEAADLIISGLRAYAESLRRAALRYRHTPMVGRTHGVHAEPITFGLTLALWWSDAQRDLERLMAARRRVAVGKLSGAVGAYGNVDPRVEEFVCRELGLEPAPISTQVLQRDGHAEFMSALAILATNLEKMALEIRGLQRTEVREVEEPFRSGQKGSSAMPHKRNPVMCERLCGLARVVRANALAAMENIPLWHQRDISNSSVERIVLPDSCILVDFMLAEAKKVIDGLQVYPERMRENLESTGGLIFSGNVLLKLVSAGLARERAYAVVQENAMRAWAGEGRFSDLLRADRRVTSLLGPEGLDECFDYSATLRGVDHIFRRLGLEEGGTT